MDQPLQISFLAVVVATIANFFFGFLWYTPLFGKAWARELKFDMNGTPGKGEMVRGLIFSLIGNFLLAFVLAHNNAAWGFVPEMKGASPVGIIANSAIFTWLGFYLPVDLNRVSWERASWKLFGINTVYHLLSLVIAASILTFMS
jgi:hypothetical protein